MTLKHATKYCVSLHISSRIEEQIATRTSMKRSRMLILNCRLLEWRTVFSADMCQSRCWILCQELHKLFSVCCKWSAGLMTTLYIDKPSLLLQFKWVRISTTFSSKFLWIVLSCEPKIFHSLFLFLIISEMWQSVCSIYSNICLWLLEHQQLASDTAGMNIYNFLKGMTISPSRTWTNQLPL